MTLNIAIAGGNAERAWAHDAHVPGLRTRPDRFRLAAVSARTLALAEAARLAFGADRAFGDTLAMVADPAVDAVAVTVKVPEHRAIVLAALAAGKHVYCEWPLGRDLAEAEEMAAAVPPGVSAMIGLQALSSPAVQDAARLVRSGALGKLRVARIFSPTAGWGAEAPAHYAYLQDRRNGATLETIAGGHTLAVIEHVVGAYREVDARASILRETVRISGSDDVVERTCADHMLVLGRHEGGCISTLEVTGATPGAAFTFDLEGEHGSLRLTSKHPGGFQVGRITLETDLPVARTADRAEGLAGAPVNVLHAWLRLDEDIAAGRPSWPDFGHAVRLTRLLDAIDVASATGMRQALA
ncbi:MAG: Gfo/Idh/MocA family oxidoreductase [Sphingomonadales bacterium]|nr:Gfo/Idh/MocA family oxidoreductase [Sphingomonadales bacterium]